jgi:hypothetical protein
MSQMDFRTPRLLFTVLNWGMGHATRCLPLIHYAQHCKWEVHIASSGTALQFLRSQCEPEKITFHEKPNQEILYSKRGNRLKIALQIPGFLLNIQAERKWTEQFVGLHGITHIVSDNCYGVVTPMVPCAMISHQWHLPVQNWGQWAVDAFVRTQAKQFDQLWTPDIAETPRLSGKLGTSTGMPKSIKPIGVLSRLSRDVPKGKWARVGMVSGPEPHRSLMENALKKWMSQGDLGGLILSGRPHGTVQHENGVTIWPNPSAAELAGALLGAKTIICRSGYSSLLDLAALGVRAILVPTPGQSEQIYLARHWAESFGFATCTQSALERGRIPEIKGLAPTHEANTLAIAALKSWVSASQSE